ncbi:MAG: hypothetical protein ACOC46_03190, partial [Pirellulales bacterium]
MPAQYGLRVSQFDRVSSLLLALVVLLAAVVLVLLVIWLSGRIFLRQAAVPVELEQIGSGEGPLQQAQPLAAPEVETTDPTVPEIADRLAAVTDAVSEQAALIEDVEPGDASQAGVGGSGGRGLGAGDRPGKIRRWELAFPDVRTLDEYPRQLDHFGIEPGVLLPGNRVAYARKLTQDSPESREGPADQEQRYYLIWREGPLEQADRRLLKRAGIDTADRPVLK